MSPDSSKGAVRAKAYPAALRRRGATNPTTPVPSSQTAPGMGTALMTPTLYRSKPGLPVVGYGFEMTFPELSRKVPSPQMSTMRNSGALDRTGFHRSPMRGHSGGPVSDLHGVPCYARGRTRNPKIVAHSNEAPRRKLSIPCLILVLSCEDESDCRR